MELYQSYNIDNAKYPIVVSIPHSGRYIPLDIRKRFNGDIILPNMDWYLDILYDFLRDMEVTMIIANYSRYVIDLNRGLYLKNEIGDYTDTLVYDKSTFGKNIYKTSLSSMDIFDRITKYYQPYYTWLEELIVNKLQVFEKVYFIDLHSFYQQTHLDVCLGNVEGRTSTYDTLSCIRDSLLNEGFSVDENNIFRGGHCIRYFKEKFYQQLECIALELRYTAYLDKCHFGEEEVKNWDDKLFLLAQSKLKRALCKTFEQWR